LIGSHAKRKNGTVQQRQREALTVRRPSGGSGSPCGKLERKLDVTNENPGYKETSTNRAVQDAGTLRGTTFTWTTLALYSDELLHYFLEWN
jgi:hypothetical protein